MNFKNLSLIFLTCISFANAARANEVLLTANQPMKIVYKIAHKNQNSQTVFSNPQTIMIEQATHIPVSLDHFDYAGIVIIAANDHALPSTDNQFDKPEQCSMTTDQTKTTGALKFTATKHSLSCQTQGGIFG